MSFRLTLALALLSIPVLAEGPQDPTLLWYSLPVPGVLGANRGDMPMVGESEPANPLVDGTSSHTRMGLAIQDDDWTSGDRAWSRSLKGFWLDALIEGPGGLAFGVDAVDLQPTLGVVEAPGRLKVVEPQGGLRLGLSADVLRLVGPDSGMAWRWAAWIPLYSDAAAWSVQTGVVYHRTWRLDVSRDWNEPATPGRISSLRDSVTFSDTAFWRSARERTSIRFGFAPTSAISLQAWGGWRDLSDPGPGDRPSWRLEGRSFFGGLQGTFESGRTALDFEARLDLGHEAARTDSLDGLGWLVPGGHLSASARHATLDSRLDGSIDLDQAWVTPVFGARGTWLWISGDGPVLPLAVANGVSREGELYQGTVETGARFALKNIRLEGRLGLSRQDLTSPPPAFWWAFQPLPGVSWSLPWRLEISRAPGLGSKASYRVTGEMALGARRGWEPGLRHEVVLGQDF